MGLFQLDEPAKKPVIVRIANQRIVEDVVLIVVLFDLLAQLDNLFRGVGAVTFRRRMLWRWGQGKRNFSITKNLA
jgi:hypothetical protein